jgi:Domain of Unknown Function (DUF1080)
MLAQPSSPRRRARHVASALALALVGLMPPAALAAEAGWRQHDMGRPRPPVVAPPAQQLPAPVPADAIVLFDGTDLSAWEAVEGGPAPWSVEDGAMVVAGGTGAIRTRRAFGDAQLHVEWAAPTEIAGESQGRGNSGVFLMGLYEVQVLDSHRNETYADGQAAAIYGQYPPLANATRPPGEWQSYDIFFRRPRFNPSGGLLEPARLTVLHNGILAQNNEEPWGPTNWLQADPYRSHADALPLMLQDHGNPVRFRNVWVRPIPARPDAPAPVAEVAAAPALGPTELDRYVGRYERAPGQYVTIRRDGPLMFASVLGPELELVARSPTEFAFVRSDVRLTFELDGDGAPKGLVMHLGGVDYPAPRVGAGRAAAD